jgi:hypothetical protein
MRYDLNFAEGAHLTSPHMRLPLNMDRYVVRMRRS